MNNNNKELPATDLLINRELTLYEYVFDIKDTNGKFLKCEFDKVPYNIGQKLIIGLLVNVYERSDKRVVDKGIVKSIEKDTDILEILTQNGVVKNNNIKDYFVKVIPAYVIMQQHPKWIDTKAFVNSETSKAVLNYIVGLNNTEGYIKWSLIFIDEGDKKLTIAVGNDNFSRGVIYIERENALFKRGSYELEVLKYNVNDISEGRFIVKWDLEIEAESLTNSNSLQNVIGY